MSGVTPWIVPMIYYIEFWFFSNANFKKWKIESLGAATYKRIDAASLIIISLFVPYSYKLNTSYQIDMGSFWPVGPNMLSIIDLGL
jgi:hypothetical protein